jgi:hypothetical protein
MSDRVFERQLEWEAGAEAIVVTKRDGWPCPPFVVGMTRLTIERDEGLQLGLLAEGTIARDELRERMQFLWALEPGTFQKSDVIVFDAFASRYEVSAFVDHDPSADFGRDQIRFRQRGHVNRLLRTWTHHFVAGSHDPELKPVGPQTRRSEWFVNGPKTADFMRWTVRRRHATYTREREFSVVTTDAMPGGGQTRDHIVVNAGSIRFALCKVPEEYAPHRWRGIAIDYGESIPDEVTREAIAEIVSFLLGRRLLRVGSTAFDASGGVVEEELINPNAPSGIFNLCSRPDCSPLPLEWHTGDVEKNFVSLVPRYVAARAELGLRDAMLAYWSACEAPVPIDLALFRGAIDALKNAWFKSMRTLSKGLHMPQDEYDDLAGEMIAGLQHRLEKHSGASAMISRVRSANRMSNAEQVGTFFAELGLPIGAAEKAGLAAANAPAHGSLTSAGKQEQLVRHGFACRALFERALLRILDYDGNYVDRTSLGYPERQLIDPPSG